MPDERHPGARIYKGRVRGDGEVVDMRPMVEDTSPRGPELPRTDFFDSSGDFDAEARYVGSAVLDERGVAEPTSGLVRKIMDGVNIIGRRERGGPLTLLRPEDGAAYLLFMEAEFAHSSYLHAFFHAARLEVVLFDAELQPGTETYQGVSIDKSGNLAFEAFDVGAGPRQFWGDSDYEWFVTVEAAEKPRVLEALLSEHSELSVEGEGDALLLGLLRAVYGGRPDAVDAVRHWLDENSIPYEFFSWA
jgi:hypothetical protein